MLFLVKGCDIIAKIIIFEEVLYKVENMKYINIFFDFDGTLVNTVEGTAASA